MGFSRQEYWSQLPVPSEDLPDSGIFLTQGLNPGLPHCRQTLYPLSHQGSPDNYVLIVKGIYFFPIQLQLLRINAKELDNNEYLCMHLSYHHRIILKNKFLVKKLNNTH